jgi:hypothetical protein
MGLPPVITSEPGDASGVIISGFEDKSKSRVGSSQSTSKRKLASNQSRRSELRKSTQNKKTKYELANATDASRVHETTLIDVGNDTFEKSGANT